MTAYLSANKNAEYHRINVSSWDGIWYPADGSKEKVMIVVSGSDGGLEHAGKHAHFLADNGVPALAVALFKTRHTGKALSKVPVERIGAVISWLKEKGYQKIGMDGTSKGSEYTFAAALAYPEIGCVVVKTPSWYYSEGLSGSQTTGECCWSYQGESLPFTPYKIRKFNMLSLFWEAKEFNLLKINTGKEIVQESVIPIEKLKIPILMFSTKVDTVWPSTESCEILCKKLETSGYAYPYQHIAFDHMSHMMLEYCGAEIKYFIKSEKENPEACYAERSVMGEKTIQWINNVWGC